MASTRGFEPGPHWCEASALTTAPSLSPPSVGNKCHKNSTTVTATTTSEKDLTNLRNLIAFKKNTPFNVEVRLFFYKTF